MARVLHMVLTTNFAGVERYVCDVALETAARGWDVAVLGGHEESMTAALGGRVRWEPSASPIEALQSVRRLGRWDVCHAHMTAGEALAVATRRVHGAPVISTRHFAAVRGTSCLGRLAAPVIAPRISVELAVSEFVARRLERPPDAVLLSAVPSSPQVWSPDNRVVLVLQRLEVEKDTMTALRAWHLSRLSEEGWSLRIVGEGAERPALEDWVVSHGLAGVTFAGWSADVAGEMSRAGMLLASAPAEPFGLTVLEGMAAGVPVVACASGGHLETVGLLAGAPLFPARDAPAAAAAVRTLLSDQLRASLSVEGRTVAARSFTIRQHVDRLLKHYDAARRRHHTRDRLLASDLV